MSPKDLLDTIRVESPCEASWDSMTGNDQVRFCEHCNLSPEPVTTHQEARATPRADIAWDLIHSGAKVNVKDGDGDTALMEAAMVNNVSVLNTLLQAGAKVDEKNDAGQTALMLATSTGQMKNVRALIAAGADMNARDKENKTALSYAKENDYDRVVRLLLSYGAVEWIQAEPK